MKRKTARRNAFAQSLFGDAPARPLAPTAPRATSQSLFSPAELTSRPEPMQWDHRPPAIPAAELPKLAREYDRITHLQSTGVARTDALDRGSKFKLYEDFIASLKRRYGPRAEQQLIAYLDTQLFALGNGRCVARRNTGMGDDKKAAKKAAHAQAEAIGAADYARRLPREAHSQGRVTQRLDPLIVGRWSPDQAVQVQNAWLRGWDAAAAQVHGWHVGKSKWHPDKPWVLLTKLGEPYNFFASRAAAVAAAADSNARGLCAAFDWKYNGRRNRSR